MVGAGARTGEEGRSLGDGAVVTLFRLAEIARGHPADGAEERRVPRGSDSGAVEKTSPAHEIGRARSGAGRSPPAARVLALEKQIRPDRRRIVDGEQVFGSLERGEAREVHGPGEVEILLPGVDLAVGDAQVLAGSRRPGELGLEARLAVPVLIREIRVGEGLGARRLLEAPGKEVPEPVAKDRPSECGFVGRHGGVFAWIPGEVLALVRRERPPGLVLERDPQRPAELVAARSRHRVHHATGEAAQLGRDAGDRRRGLLERVLDWERTRLAFDDLLDGNAVHQVQVLVRGRAGDHHRPNRCQESAPSRRGDAGGQEHRSDRTTVDGQTVDQPGRIGRAQRGRLPDHARRLGGHRHRLVQSLELELRVDT